MVNYVFLRSAPAHVYRPPLDPARDDVAQRLDGGGGSSGGGSGGSGGHTAPDHVHRPPLDPARDDVAQRLDPDEMQEPQWGPSEEDIRKVLIQAGLAWMLEHPKLFDIFMDAYIESGSVEVAVYEVRRSREYAKAFPGNYNSDTGLVAMDEATYIEYRQEGLELFKRYGIPTSLWTKNLSGYVQADLSLDEIEERIINGFVASQYAPQEVRDELRRFYGVTAGELAAFWLDPDATWVELQRKFISAQIGAAGIQTGWGQLERRQAERLAGLGVDMDEARAGMASLVRQSQLFTPLIGRRGTTVTRDEQLAAAFEANADVLMAIEYEARRRVGEFQSRGGAAEGTSGLVGFRSSTI